MPRNIGSSTNTSGWDSSVGLFSAYRSAAVSLATNATVVFDAEEFDVSGWYNTTTGMFIPQVAGTYRFSWMLRCGATLTTAHFWNSILMKNTDYQKRGSFMGLTPGGVVTIGTATLQMNGSTDSASIRTVHNIAGPPALSVGSIETYFQGEKIG